MSGNNVTVDWNDAEIRKKIRQAIDIGTAKVAAKVFNRAKTTSDFADQTGDLRKSIKKHESKYEQGGFVVVATEPHAHLIEYGHKQVHGGSLPGNNGKSKTAKNPKKRGKGRVTGVTAPIPFMRNAVKAEKARGEQAIINEVKKALS